jgi:hypothetical protein
MRCTHFLPLGDTDMVFIFRQKTYCAKYETNKMDGHFGGISPVSTKRNLRKIPFRINK